MDLVLDGTLGSALLFGAAPAVDVLVGLTTLGAVVGGIGGVLLHRRRGGGSPVPRKSG